MATKTRRRAVTAQRFSVQSGGPDTPWARVNDAEDPGETRLTTLFDATDIVIADAAHGSGVRPRPGIQGLGAKLSGAAWSQQNQHGTGGGAPNRDGQGIYDHTEADGTIRRFFFIGNKVYRWDGVVTGGFIGTMTDVTPGGVTIAPGVSQPRVFCASLPWIGTTLGAAAITGTYIDFDGAGNAWTAWGKPEVFGGSVVFIANTLNGVASRDVLLWSAPADPAVGYKQSGYAKFWELFQTGTDPIYGILGTNAALYYWRATSIGSIPGPTLDIAKSAATHDDVSTTVGCIAPATIVKAGDVIFFSDQIGRPHRLPIGGAPEDLSWQMRRTMADGSGVNLDTDNVGKRAWASWVPDLNLVAYSLWGNTTDYGGGVPNRLYLFAADSGAYQGKWFPPTWAGNSGAWMDIGGVVRDAAGNKRFYMIGSGNPTSGTIRDPAWWGYIYEQALVGRASHGGAFDTYVEGQLASGGYVSATITPHAVGYDDERDKVFDLVTASVGPVGLSNSGTIALDYQTTKRAFSGTPTQVIPLSTSDAASTPDGVGRAEWGIWGHGRYIRPKIYFAYGAGIAFWTYAPKLHGVRIGGHVTGYDSGGP
jgi:hypothetical protein